MENRASVVGGTTKAHGTRATTVLWVLRRLCVSTQITVTGNASHAISTSPAM